MSSGSRILCGRCCAPPCFGADGLAGLPEKIPIDWLLRNRELAAVVLIDERFLEGCT